MFFALSCVLFLLVLISALGIYLLVVKATRTLSLNLDDARGIYLVALMFLMFIGCVFCFYVIPWLVGWLNSDLALTPVSFSSTLVLLLIHLSLVVTLMGWGMVELGKEWRRGLL
ncbi:MAG: hypothetical protein COB04_17305 [Gammaproteobacteria bacterium]|nr:MAG: hypothetical protein COB04_17305 [Gammaproteobacteria bacterium]